MSTNRTSALVPESQLPRGPNGRALCRWCKTEVPKGKRTFCGDPECVHQYSIRSNTGYAREQVFKRDQGVCCMCQVDTTTLLEPPHPELLELRRQYKELKRDSIRIAEEHAKVFRNPKNNMNLHSLPGFAQSIDQVIKARQALSKATLRLFKSEEAKEHKEKLAKSGWPKNRLHYGATLWDMDHIVPVVEGGGECGLENLRTLCCLCHKKVTKELMQRLKKKRKEEAAEKFLSPKQSPSD